MIDDLDVAIVGMACRFPGARTTDEFWRNVCDGVESIARLTDEEILKSGVPAAHIANPHYVKAAPVLEAPEYFDAAFFGLSPAEATAMDPQHRLMLELACEALEDGGFDPDRYQGRIGVFAGSALNSYFLRTGLHIRLAEEYIPTLIGNDKDFLSTRVSYQLNLRGPSLSVQTACSTSLVAIHLARQSLLSEETDLALAGAVSVRVPHRAGYFCDAGSVVSSDGRVRPFDAKATGTVFGSGGGVLVLKRLADALSSGDSIHAVIKGSAVNNDGSGKAGYTAPSVNRQADAVVEALVNAGVLADTISYVEAHGSGTPVGDPIELSALTKAFRTFTNLSQYCAIGSVKANIGHLDAAAGIAGTIKTVLALKHRILPPSLNYTDPNPEIDFRTTPFYVNTQRREWVSSGPRRAGIMSTGMGGTNAHLVLEEAPDLPVTSVVNPPHLLVLSAKTETALDCATDRLREFLCRDAGLNMADVAHTLRIGRKAHPHRRFVLCADRNDALVALDLKGPARMASAEVDRSQRRPIVLLLPGVGDQYVGMGHGLYQSWQTFREAVDQCARILESHLGVDIRTILYPPGLAPLSLDGPSGVDLKRMLGRQEETPAHRRPGGLNGTLFTHPALFTVEYAAARLWQSLGITPTAIVGHSMGEYVAACLAGVMTLEDALGLISTRARLVNQLPPGRMLAVSLTEAELQPLLGHDLSIALINGPGLCVVAGPVDRVADFEKELRATGISSRPVRAAHAFHSRLLDPIVEPYEAEVRKHELREPQIPFISNVTGTWITKDEATSPEYWARHLNHTARFDDALHHLWQLENAILLEAGPGRTLSVLAMQHPDRRDRAPAPAISSIRHQYETQPDSDFLWSSLGKLWLTGTEIAWENIEATKRSRRTSLPTYPWEKGYFWLEPLPVAQAHGSSGTIPKNPDISRWLYLPSWKRVLQKSAAKAEVAPATAATRWLIYMDELGVASALAARIESDGHHLVSVTAGSVFEQTGPRAFVIDPANPQHYESLLRTLRVIGCLPDRIVHAWSVTRDDPPSSSARFSTMQNRGFYSLLFLAKALAKESIGHEIRLAALSNGLQDVLGTEVLCPDKSCLLAACTVIGQEYPNIRTSSIDLDSRDLIDRVERAATFALAELLEPDADKSVACRDGQRWVQTYDPLAIASVVSGRSPFRSGGVYLITGGLATVGTCIAEHLATKYRARLILVGRSSGASRKEALDRLERLGAEVLYVTADVANVADMQRVFERGRRRFGVLHGVIHGAGISSLAGASEIKNLTRDPCESHFQAKAHALAVLEELIGEKPLDFCLLLSSLSSILGGIGHAPYAASNLYMDSFARHHNRSSRSPWLSVNWDLWRASTPAQPAANPGNTLSGLGMTNDESLDLLERLLLVRNASQLVVSTGDLDARIKQWIKLESLDGAASPLPSVRQAGPAGRSSALWPYEPPRDETERRIAAIWQDVLGIHRVGINDNFSQLGGHSLLAMKIIAELRRAFRVDLTVKAFFDASTVAALSTYIKELIVAEVEAVTDEEARRLISAADAPW